MTTKFFRSNKKLILISIFSFLLFFLLANLKPTGIFWSLDEGGKFIYLESVIQEKNPKTSLIYPGHILDPNHDNIALFFYSKIGDKIFSWWQVGFPLLSLPFYKLFGFGGLYFLPALAGALIVYISGKITKYLSDGSDHLESITAVIIAFCSPVFFYSVTFWEHSISVALLMLTIYFLLISKGKSRNLFFYLAGISGSLSIFFRTEAILIIAGFSLVLLLLNRKRFIPFSIGLGITTLSWAGLNYWLMGFFISPNVQAVQSLPNLNGLIKTGFKYIPYTLFNAPMVSAFDLGRELLIIGTILFIFVFGFSIIPKLKFFAILIFVGLSTISFYVLLQPGLYRSVHGFLLICPIISLAFIVFRSKIWNEKRDYFLYMSGGVSIFFIGFFMRAWLAAGGLQWGPRYMLGLYPLLIISSMVGVSELFKKSNKLKQNLIGFSILLSLTIGFGFQIRGYYTMVQTMKLYEQSANVLRELKDEIIITDCTWMPMVIPDLYWNGNIFREPPNTALLDAIKVSGKNSYLSVKMISCNTMFIDEVIKNYEDNPSGLEITRISIPD